MRYKITPGKKAILYWAPEKVDCGHIMEVIVTLNRNYAVKYVAKRSHTSPTNEFSGTITKEYNQTAVQLSDIVQLDVVFDVNDISGNPFSAGSNPIVKIKTQIVA